MFEIIRSILGISNDLDRIIYEKLQKRKDINYELEYQKRLLESPNKKVLSVICNPEEIIILYKILLDEIEEDDSAVFIRAKIITKRGVQCPDLRLDATYDRDKEEIHIGDIRVHGKNINRGYGSLMLNELLNIARRQNVKGITGWISSVDWDHVERLKHFYKKHGFKVSLNRKEQEGFIVWGSAEIPKDSKMWRFA